MVEFLLQKGTNTNFVNKFNETPPLKFASENGHLEVSNLQKKEGHNFSYEYDGKCTPLGINVWSSRSGKVASSKEIIESLGQGTKDLLC